MTGQQSVLTRPPVTDLFPAELRSILDGSTGNANALKKRKLNVGSITAFMQN